MKLFALLLPIAILLSSTPSFALVNACGKLMEITYEGNEKVWLKLYSDGRNSLINCSKEVLKVDSGMLSSALGNDEITVCYKSANFSGKPELRFFIVDQ